jgi:hypothetical protein
MRQINHLQLSSNRRPHDTNLITFFIFERSACLARARWACRSSFEHVSLPTQVNRVFARRILECIQGFFAGPLPALMSGQENKRMHTPGHAKDQRGFTIITIMVAMALLTMVMSAFADLTIMNNKAQKGLEIKTDFDEFSNNLQQIMAAEPLCTAALQGVAYNSSLVITDPLVSTKVLAKAGDQHAIGWSMKSLQFQDLTAVPGYTNTWRGTLYIEGARNTKVALGGPSMSRTVLSIFFVLNADGSTINHCYGTSTAWMNNPANQQAGQTPSANSANSDGKDPCTERTDQGNHYGSDGNNVHCDKGNHNGTAQ